tara:strand:- start:23039 stop:23590 length:552 start_codon:yes stop_codon:yes gene_type:complete
MEYPTLQQLFDSKLDFSNEEQDFLSTIEKRSKVINYVYSILGQTRIDIITPLDPEILDQAEKFYYNPENQKKKDTKWLITYLNEYNLLKSIIKKYEKNKEHCCDWFYGYNFENENRLNNYPGYTNKSTKTQKNTYTLYGAMDDNNKKAMDVWQAGGVDAAIKHMMTDSDGKPRSYSEMRELYG